MTASALPSARVEPAEIEMRAQAGPEELGACGGEVLDVDQGSARRDIDTPSSVTHSYNLRSRKRTTSTDGGDKMSDRPPWRYRLARSNGSRSTKKEGIEKEVLVKS